ncbi:YfcL protein [Pseudidiomarina maritima]|uniref:YfcL protein n=1 Tax=Pseudidiomarina maritima TaxID=519453 RepID=A0A1I6GN57_9GAMM|nr:YfcL family protein [Pseudidiomarina maritima]SFR43662.1 YfcL protein [Pseudidiomarina maritima]
MASAAFHDYIQSLEQVFDDVVATGSDDELFASGYLRGHFDLVVAQLELNDNASADAVLPEVHASVEQAKHELAPVDMAHIQAMLTRLEAVAAQVA